MARTRCAVAFLALLVLAAAGAGAQARDLGREALAPADGWAAATSGTTGGAAAAPDRVHVVASRAELIRALGGDNGTNRSNGVPKIVYVKGTIQVSADDAGMPMGPAEYRDRAFDLDAYLKEYAPETWGQKKVSGPLEEARSRSKKAQENRIVINVGSNTTIVGLGADARIVGGSLKMEKVDNVIIRNIEFEAPLDFFPQWDPTDGSSGNWNSEYDNITIREATHVWIDHCTFSDGAHPDSASGARFGRRFQQHDGQLDITNASDFVTVSWCVFRDHDKVILIGSSDSRTTDEGHFRVTLHHNHFLNVTQRLPRARFGQVHVYNNLYEATPGSEYKLSYAWGVGVSSRLYAQNNAFVLAGTDPGAIIDIYKGIALYEAGTTINGAPVADLVEQANRVRNGRLARDAGWTPTLHGVIDASAVVPVAVRAQAGAGRLR